MPEQVRVAEVGSRRGQHGVAVVFRKRASTVGRVGHRLCLVLGSRRVVGDDGVMAEARRVVLVHHARTTEDSTQSVGDNRRRLCLPVYEVARRRLAPRHVLPHRTVGVPLVAQVPHTILVEHAIRIIHPPVRGRVVIQRTETLAVAGVKRVRILHLAPAGQLRQGPLRAAVATEEDVEQLTALQLQWHKVVYLVHRQPYVQRLYDVVLFHYADGRYLGLLLHGQQQIALALLQAKHGMAVAQHVGGHRPSRGDGQHCQHGQ